MINHRPRNEVLTHAQFQTTCHVSHMFKYHLKIFKIYKTNLIADAAPSAQKPKKNSAQATPKTPNAVESTQPTATQQASFHKV